MFLGIVFAFIASSIWGLIFVAPLFMQELSAIEVILARYYFYGLFSVTFLASRWLTGRWQGLSKSIFLRAFSFALIAQVGYYLCIVYGVRFASGSITALIMGISPITIALYGNWKQRECSFQQLFLPSLAIFLGLLLVNAPSLYYSAHNGTLQDYLIGVGCSFLALSAWTWYAVGSSGILKQNPQLSPADFASWVGACTGFWALVLTACVTLPTHSIVPLSDVFASSSKMFSFLCGGCLLGGICSWMAFLFWNKGCSRIPISLSGQIFSMQTISGLCYVHLLEKRFPAPLELAGILLMLVGVGLSLFIFRKKKASPTTTPFAEKA